jgi:hypothetical protein
MKGNKNKDIVYLLLLQSSTCFVPVQAMGSRPGVGTS